MGSRGSAMGRSDGPTQGTATAEEIHYPAATDYRPIAMEGPIDVSAPSIDELLELMSRQIMQVTTWTQAEGFLESYRSASPNARGLFHAAVIKLAARRRPASPKLRRTTQLLVRPCLVHTISRSTRSARNTPSRREPHAAGDRPRAIPRRRTARSPRRPGRSRLKAGAAVEVVAIDSQHGAAEHEHGCFPCPRLGLETARLGPVAGSPFSISAEIGGQVPACSRTARPRRSGPRPDRTRSKRRWPSKPDCAAIRARAGHSWRSRTSPVRPASSRSITVSYIARSISSSTATT